MRSIQNRDARSRRRRTRRRRSGSCKSQPVVPLRARTFAPDPCRHVRLVRINPRDIGGGGADDENMPGRPGLPGQLFDQCADDVGPAPRRDDDSGAFAGRRRRAARWGRHASRLDPRRLTLKRVRSDHGHQAIASPAEALKSQGAFACALHPDPLITATQSLISLQCGEGRGFYLLLAMFFGARPRRAYPRGLLRKTT